VHRRRKSTASGKYSYVNVFNGVPAHSDALLGRRRVPQILNRAKVHVRLNSSGKLLNSLKHAQYKKKMSFKKALEIDEHINESLLLCKYS
jgi:hypothetical protein